MSVCLFDEGRLCLNCIGFHDNDDDIAIKTRARDTCMVTASRAQSYPHRIEFEGFVPSGDKCFYHT